MSQELVPRLSLYFGAEPSRPAILARLALGRPGPGDPDLGRGWALLALLTVAGLLTGLLAGLLTRWWVATWRN